MSGKCENKCEPKAQNGIPGGENQLVLAVRGCVQVAGRVLILGNTESAWTLRARHGSNAAQFPYHCHETEVAARRLVRGDPKEGLPGAVRTASRRPSWSPYGGGRTFLVPNTCMPGAVFAGLPRAPIWRSE